MLEARIQQQFFELAELIYQSADVLSRPVADAAQAAFNAWTAGAKLLACGQGQDGDLARWCVSALMMRSERPRPPLPALWLAPQQLSLLSPRPGELPDADSLLMQVRALGQPGDVLLAFAGMAHDNQTMRAVVQEAHSREMSVVLFTGGEPGAWPDLLAETDVWVPVTAERGARVRELHLLAVHSFCEAVDDLLLGDLGTE